MGIPTTVALGFDVLNALGAGDVPRALALATKKGKKRLSAILETSGDERATALLRWNKTAHGRTDGTRGMCRFAELGDRVAVLDLALEDGRLRVDDVRIIQRDDYDSFGVVDDFAARNMF